MTRISAVVVVMLLIIARSGTTSAQDGPPEFENSNGPELEVDTDLPVGPILLGSFGLAAVAVGVGFGWQADQEHENWDKARKAGDPTGEMDDLADDVKSHSIAANVFIFGGAGIAAISVVWLLLSRSRDVDNGREDTAAIDWYPAFGNRHAGLAIRF